ncbi:MAG: 30S ribosomal protein S8 [Candidatus Paceibacterota bacterium]|nr:30S ribosomal protein S8 [Candidatus Paceibacterota bacterium]MDD3548524.1 30S ribosomal protein S8 [Candidatus Paceibacterota bacterium]MDD4999067.1 30S ribosomal protein S8 [Candidatus Paceibacterota bacterium]MDD5545232.1 30S ribosomal protein S8 [Candidatus Paceibacterota bacterium]
MLTDSISDMITRIRNAQMVKKETVLFPYSKIKWEILKVLKEKGYFEEVLKIKKKNKNYIEVKIKYEKNGKPKINEIKRVSKPSQRIYLPASRLWPVKKGFGIRVLSTPQGIVSDREAKKMNVGGEVILEIW